MTTTTVAGIVLTGSQIVEPVHIVCDLFEQHEREHLVWSCPDVNLFLDATSRSDTLRNIADNLRR